MPTLLNAVVNDTTMQAQHMLAATPLLFGCSIRNARKRSRFRSRHRQRHILEKNNRLVTRPPQSRTFRRCANFLNVQRVSFRPALASRSTSISAYLWDPINCTRNLALSHTPSLSNTTPNEAVFSHQRPNVFDPSSWQIRHSSTVAKTLRPLGKAVSSLACGDIFQSIR